MKMQRVKKKREEVKPSGTSGAAGVMRTARTADGTADEFQTLTQEIVNYSNVDIPWVDYLGEISRKLIDFFSCDSLELHIRKKDNKNLCEVIRRTGRSFSFETIRGIPDRNNVNIDTSLPFFTKNGSFWSGDIKKTLAVYPEKEIKSHYCGFKIDNTCNSIAIVPIKVGKDRVGFMQLMCRKKNFFTQSEIELYENFVITLGLVLLNQQAQAALTERVKEMTCLYGIAHAVDRYRTSLDDILTATVNLIPPAWQYPEITQGRIVLNGRTYATPGFKKSPDEQTADIVVNGSKCGMVEVVYTKKRPNLDEGPFLEEERHLINTIASELALIIERKQSELEEKKLQAQLRHADRLATIGQLASGVAHELNEPLCNILGFAQLAGKSSKLPEQAMQDLEKIINASLHAREIVRKLLIFSRQMPTKKMKVNINNVIKEGLYFLESRCKKEGIDVHYSLADELPEIIIDPDQLKQVVVNLVVNAIQAMPEGGKLYIETKSGFDTISLVVEDNGVGMSKEVLKQIFLPFFTTKDVGEGTGLGLSVVHGIVNSNGGKIKVDSSVGQGSRFEITLPLMGSVE
jgi:two-component system NtrC family sensor kinase